MNHVLVVLAAPLHVAHVPTQALQEGVNATASTPLRVLVAGVAVNSARTRASYKGSHPAQCVVAYACCAFLIRLACLLRSSVLRIRLRMR